MCKLRHLAFGLLIIAAFLALCARAQTNLTQIRDLIYNANGTPFNGMVTITWTGSATNLGGSISPLSTSARIYNGALSVLVVPTTSSVTGTYYQALYVSNDGTTMWTETWQVPARSTPLTIAAVRISSTGGGNGTGGGGNPGVPKYATLPISMSDVTNLNSSLSQINSTVSGLNSTVTNLNSSYTSLSNTVTGINSSVGTISSTVTGLSSSVGTLNNTVGAMTNTVNSLNSTVGVLGSTVTSQGTSLAALNNTVGTLTSTVNNLAATVNNLSSSSQVAFIDAEVPAGLIDGTNTAFTLSQMPAPTTSLEIYRNGLVQASGVDYNLTGTAINFLPASVPLPGDLIQAYYRIVGTPSAAPNFSDTETPGGATNGTNVSFTLANSPNPARSLKLYKNGMLLQQGNDYSINAKTITFVYAATPQSGDSVTAYYRY